MNDSSLELSSLDILKQDQDFYLVDARLQNLKHIRLQWQSSYIQKDYGNGQYSCTLQAKSPKIYRSWHQDDLYGYAQTYIQGYFDCEQLFELTLALDRESFWSTKRMNWNDRIQQGWNFLWPFSVQRVSLNKRNQIRHQNFQLLDQFVRNERYRKQWLSRKQRDVHVHHQMRNHLPWQLPA